MIFWMRISDSLRKPLFATNIPCDWCRHSAAILGPPMISPSEPRRFQQPATIKLRLGLVKLMTDGSIQGFTAQLKWPGYYRGPNHGIWNIAPEALFDLVGTLNREGLQVHVHVNGDAASELAIKAFAKGVNSPPATRPPAHPAALPNGRPQPVFIRWQHSDLALIFLPITSFSLEISIGISLWVQSAPHEWDACRTALDEGVNLSIHSDAPVTPMGPLTVAWCAANRLTGSGQVLGPMECINLDEAMRAITLGPARSLHLDHEIGSIESGKTRGLCHLGCRSLRGRRGGTQ